MGFQFEVGVIQSILYQCGFTKKDILIQFKDGKFIFNSASRVNKVIITSAQGRIFETITNDGKNKFYEENQWIIYDNSRENNTFNTNKLKKTVLLVVDIDRPTYVPRGISVENNNRLL